jgi:hypothetical protein
MTFETTPFDPVTSSLRVTATRPAHDRSRCLACANAPADPVTSGRSCNTTGVHPREHNDGIADQI